MTKYIVSLTLLVTGLSGCLQNTAQYEQEYCGNQGFKPGTEAYLKCYTEQTEKLYRYIGDQRCLADRRAQHGRRESQSQSEEYCR
jgi:hypothetical protein